MTRTIEQVLESETPAWMQLPGVVGTAQGEANGRPCILVLVTRRTRDLEAAIPDSVEGHRVRLEESGAIQAR